MKKALFLISFLFLFGCSTQLSTPSNQINMKLTSPDFVNNGQITDKFTCKGQNINPQLEIVDVPDNAESLVLIVDDPDALAGNWTHWTVWNIDPGIALIKENSLPVTAIEGVTSFGKSGYGGPCPPSGTHRYYFKLYALNTKLNLPTTVKVGDLVTALNGHILDQAELIGLYGR